MKRNFLSSPHIAVIVQQIDRKQLAESSWQKAEINLPYIVYR